MVRVCKEDLLYIKIKALNKNNTIRNGIISAQLRNGIV
jgi:hypothetical protein